MVYYKSNKESKSKKGDNKMKNYQPKTGELCSCKKGIERDNCPQCEGTGQKIDFKKIREKNVTPQVEALPGMMPLGFLRDHFSIIKIDGK
jgi:CDGSH-type Zn-finger protein